MKYLGPKVVGFLVEFAGIALVCRAYKRWRRGGSCGNFQTLGDQFPGPVDGFLFEIIAEAPVAEHLEEGVVIGVEADIFEIVMFAAGADAFLGVGGAGVAAGNGAGPFVDVRRALAQEDGHELVHAGVGEEQVRGIGHEAGRGHDGVLLRLEEIQKRLANFSARHKNQPARFLVRLKLSRARTGRMGETSCFRQIRNPNPESIKSEVESRIPNPLRSAPYRGNRGCELNELPLG